MKKVGFDTHDPSFVSCRALSTKPLQVTGKGHKSKWYSSHKTKSHSEQYLNQKDMK